MQRSLFGSARRSSSRLGATAASLCGLLLAGACDPRQVAVFSVKDPPENSGLGVYYQLDGGPIKGAAVRQEDAGGRVNQFGIDVPVDTTGKLTAYLFGYHSGSPCSSSKGVGDVTLSGKYKQDVSVAMMPTVANSCVSLTEPVSFPNKPALWAMGPKEVWLAGDQGVVVRWDGTFYQTVPLASALVDKLNKKELTRWNAVFGWSSNDVWLAGDQGVIGHWDGTIISLIPLSNAMPQWMPFGAPDWRGLTGGSSVLKDVWFVGSNGHFGYVGQNGTSVDANKWNCADYAAVNPVTPNIRTYTENFNAISCTTTPAYDCWAVGDKGLVVEFYNDTINIPKRFNCIDYSMIRDTTTSNVLKPVTASNLNGVWNGQNVRRMPTAYEVRVAGQGGTIVRGVPGVTMTRNIATLLPTEDEDYSTAVKGIANVDLTSIFGTGVDNLYVTGKNGTLLQWKINTKPMPMENVFTLIPTGINADFSSGSASTAQDIVIAGPAPVMGGPARLVYRGPLYMPIN